MAILDMPETLWWQALELAGPDRPDALILEGTWWRERATRARLARLDDVRELAFPEMFVGKAGTARVAYCCAYGAPRAVEPAHVFAHIGTPLLIQIGTCGTLDVSAGTGLVILPAACAARDGISPFYGAGAAVETDGRWRRRAAYRLSAMGIETREARHLTWPSLFAQSDAMCADWAAEGLLSVDMETAAVAAVACHFGVRSVAMLSVWDALPHGRTFLDPLPAADAARLSAADEAVFEAALGLAGEVAALRAGVEGG